MKSDTFRFKQFEMRNSMSGLKIGTDGVLLGAWASFTCKNHVWDIGCGTGLIALMLAQRFDCKITGIEIEHNAAAEAQYNAMHSPWSERIRVVEGDIANVADSLTVPDVIVSNPPYFAVGKSMSAGSDSRDLARRDSFLSFEKLIELAGRYLSASGELFMVSPYSRKSDIEWYCGLAHLYVRHYTSVVSKEQNEPNRLLWHISRVDGPIISDQLTIRKMTGEYTSDFIELTKDYYLNF